MPASVFQSECHAAESILSNSMGSNAASLLVSPEVKDSQSGFRLIRMDRLRTLPLQAKKHEIEMESLIKMSLAGCRIVHAPIAAMDDNNEARSKMHPIRDTIRICMGLRLERFLGF
jgi:hypothetical protein